MAQSSSCKHCACYCKEYVIPTSKWSKGRCRRCNHSASVHGKVVPDVSFYGNKIAAATTWTSGIESNGTSNCTDASTASRYEGLASNPYSNKTKYNTLKKIYDYYISEKNTKPSNTYDLINFIQLHNLRTFSHKDINDFLRQRMPYTSHKKHSKSPSSNKGRYTKKHNKTSKNTNKKSRSMTTTNNNDTVTKLYKMYCDSKRTKPSTPRQLQAFGTSIGIHIKWSEANRFMKNNPISATSHQKRKTFINGNKNGWKQKTVDKWSNNDVLHWIKSMSMSNILQNKLIDEISNSGCNGKDIVSLRSTQEIGEAFDISSNQSLCRNILNGITNLKSVESNDRLIVSSNSNTFRINIFSQNKCITLKENVTKRMKLRNIAKLYKRQSGVHAQLEDIHLYSHSKLLPQWKTLEAVNIVDEKHLITVKFGTNGASHIVYNEY